jgi:hypothetical protein
MKPFYSLINPKNTQKKTSDDGIKQLRLTNEKDCYTPFDIKIPLNHIPSSDLIGRQMGDPFF